VKFPFSRSKSILTISRPWLRRARLSFKNALSQERGCRYVKRISPTTQTPVAEKSEHIRIVLSNCDWT
jgi:hypothetical protein